MIFNEIIGMKNRPGGISIFLREAVRAIIIKNNKILMVHNNKGDFKFPGGGVEEGEDYRKAIIREVLEETGYRVSRVEEKIGTVIERREDIYKENTIFEMNSNYYLCTILDEKGDQELSEHEAELELSPVWIGIEEAIKNNDRLITNKEDKNPWVTRELYVLKRIKEHYFK